MSQIDRYFDLLQKIYIYGDIVGPRGKETKELRNVMLLVDDYNIFYVEPIRSQEDVYRYMFAELAWYLTGDRALKKISPYSKFWNNITNFDGTINSQYGEAVFYRKNSHGITPFEWALISLQKDPDTRQALMLYNDKDLFFPDNKDLICNQHQHFMIRKDWLDCSVSLRSSDAIYGLTFNIPWWSFVHQCLFLKLKETYPNLKLGVIIAHINSSHIYKNKYELVKQMVFSNDKTFSQFRLTDVPPLGKNFEFYQGFLLDNWKEVVRKQ